MRVKYRTIFDSLSLICWGALTARFPWVGLGIAAGYCLPLIIDLLVDKCEQLEIRRAERRATLELERAGYEPDFENM